MGRCESLRTWYLHDRHLSCFVVFPLAIFLSRHFCLSRQDFCQTFLPDSSLSVGIFASVDRIFARDLADQTSFLLRTLHLAIFLRHVSFRCHLFKIPVHSIVQYLQLFSPFYPIFPRSVRLCSPPPLDRTACIYPLIYYILHTRQISKISCDTSVPASYLACCSYSRAASAF
jgi:hypothetical protein